VTIEILRCWRPVTACPNAVTLGLLTDRGHTLSRIKEKLGSPDVELIRIAIGRGLTDLA